MAGVGIYKKSEKKKRKKTRTSPRKNESNQDLDQEKKQVLRSYFFLFKIPTSVLVSMINALFFFFFAVWFCLISLAVGCKQKQDYRGRYISFLKVSAETLRKH